MHAARCEYITFVDGDDTIPTFVLSTLFNYTADDIDIITGNHQYHIPTKIGKISKAGCMDVLLTLKRPTATIDKKQGWHVRTRHHSEQLQHSG